MAIQYKYLIIDSSNKKNYEQLPENSMRSITTKKPGHYIILNKKGELQAHISFIGKDKRSSKRKLSRMFFDTLNIKDFMGEGVDEEVKAAVLGYADKLKKAGYEIEEISMPTLKYALAIYYIVVPAEIASNLSRYDGIRYGHRSKDAKDLDEIYSKTRDEGFMPENKRRIMIGNFVLSSGFYDAYFLKAAKARTVIINEYNKAFEDCDFLLTPCGPGPAFKIGEKANDPIAMYLEDAMTVPINLAGIPGLAIPAGKTKEGLPIGLQLLGPRRSDKNLIEFAKELE
jgi:aspartyl-tRNA(Asn)/glutamyl-tRNA(Gln) amidotransferase subunit A